MTMFAGCQWCGGSICNCTTTIYIASAETNYLGDFPAIARETRAARKAADARARQRKGFSASADEVAEEPTPCPPAKRLVRASPPEIVGGGPMRRRWR
jgi:hypothetical protein